MAYFEPKILATAPISLNFRDPHFGLFWGLGLLLGYLATSNAKFDVRFLPISYYGDKILRLSCLVIEILILGYLGGFGGI